MPNKFNIFIQKLTSIKQLMKRKKGKEPNLTKMPVLVIEKILSHIPNLSNVSLTCTFLYEIVCDMEKHRRVMYIRGTYDAATSAVATRLTIDDDAMFDSMMNSSRTIKQINLSGDAWCLQLNERQLLRLTAIMKQFGENIMILRLNRFALTINTIIELLQQTPKLESFSFLNGAVLCSDTEETTFQLANLKALEFRNTDGILGIGNSITAGSSNTFRCCGSQSKQLIPNFLTKQQNIKHLILDGNFDRKFLCVNHEKLETLILGSYVSYSFDEWVQVLKCLTNLKELRVTNSRLSISCFEWMCNNLKKLEVFEVRSLERELQSSRSILAMLAKLKKLRHFRTREAWYFSANRIHCNSLEKLEFGYSGPYGCGELLNRVMDCMVRAFTNLTYLEMRFDDFTALSFVLGQCTTLTSLSSIIEYPSAHTFNQQRLPNMKHLTLSTHSWNALKRSEISQSISALVRAMPNLKSLSMPFSNPIFNVNLMKEFINGSKNLDYFFVNGFELESDFCADDVLGIIQRLSHQLRGFQLMFKTKGQLNSHAMKQILSNEYVDRYGVVDDYGSSRFCMYKLEVDVYTFSDY